MSPLSAHMIAWLDQRRARLDELIEATRAHVPECTHDEYVCPGIAVIKTLEEQPREVFALPCMALVGRWTVARCSAQDCGARVIWALTERGARMMVDADPALGGNILLIGVGKTPTAVVLPAKTAFGRTDLRKSHFATCTRRPKTFRKPRASRRSR